LVFADIGGIGYSAIDPFGDCMRVEDDDGTTAMVAAGITSDTTYDLYDRRAIT
jgi:hypothetical protein